MYKCFQSFYPLKEASQVDELVESLSESEKVNVKALFNTDKDGNVSNFLKKLYSQFYAGESTGMITDEWLQTGCYYYVGV